MEKGAHGWRLCDLVRGPHVNKSLPRRVPGICILTALSCCNFDQVEQEIIALDGLRRAPVNGALPLADNSDYARAVYAMLPV